jgi:hypothetical protein
VRIDEVENSIVSGYQVLVGNPDDIFSRTIEESGFTTPFS